MDFSDISWYTIVLHRRSGSNGTVASKGRHKTRKNPVTFEYSIIILHINELVQVTSLEETDHKTCPINMITNDNTKQ